VAKANDRVLASMARTATSQVHEAIKKRVLDGHYQPHEFIRESSLAHELEVSRTPVREALRELVSEGWLEAIPHQGARVAAWTERDAREVFQLRLVLEPMAAHMACLNMSADRRERLESLAVRMEALSEPAMVTSEARDAIAVLNHEFHRELIQASDNLRLCNVLDMMVRTSIIRRNFAQYDHRALQRSMHQHREILQAIDAGSPTWTESVMLSHLLAARELHESVSEHTRMTAVVQPPGSQDSLAEV
jgi:DNA-binding GntR family transcriptional regulator